MLIRLTEPSKALRNTTHKRLTKCYKTVLESLEGVVQSLLNFEIQHPDESLED